MSNLKDLANRAKSRLLNKGLRDTYSNANIANYGNMNFLNGDVDSIKNNTKRESQFKYLLRENRMMGMTSDDKERFILDTIRKYHEDKRKQEREIG